MSQIEDEFSDKLSVLEQEIAGLFELLGSFESLKVQESAEILVFVNFLISSLSLVILKLTGSNTFKVKAELKRVQQYFEKIKKPQLIIDPQAAKRMVEAGLGLASK